METQSEILNNISNNTACLNGTNTRLHQLTKLLQDNILITNATFNDSETIYRCQLTIADKIKLKNNESVGVHNKETIPYFGTDDTVDIHANTLSIINDLTSYTQYAVDNFEINADINCEAFKDKFENGLGGWVATFDLTTHNDRPRCLYNLLT